MRKVVINVCFGGFGLSAEALAFLGRDNDYDIERDNLSLVACVEQLGARANASYAKLKIVEIPSDVQWHIEEYDGHEHVAENHRKWS